MLTSEQIRAARMLLRWEQKDLARQSGVSLPTIKRLETKPGEMKAHVNTLGALRAALETAGVHFVDGDDMGPGVRLKDAVKEDDQPAQTLKDAPARKMTLLREKTAAERAARVLRTMNRGQKG
jgi:transcriptional regulator with XRE-family HTH domain